jgi:hypothetical protein
MVTLLILLAAFGVSYIVLDSSILEPVRRRLWPSFDCYFCVGFWAGALLYTCNYLATEFFGHPWVGLMKLLLVSLAACGVSGWLGNHLVIHEREIDEG